MVSWGIGCDGDAITCRLGQRHGTRDLRRDGDALAAQELDKLPVKLSEWVEAVDHDEDPRVCPRAPGNLQGAHRGLHIPRAREHGNEDHVRGAAPVLHALAQDARRVHDLKVAAFRIVWVVTDLMDAPPLRVGGYEGDRPPPSLKGEGKLVCQRRLRAIMRSFA